MRSGPSDPHIARPEKHLLAGCLVLDLYSGWPVLKAVILSSPDNCWETQILFYNLPQQKEIKTTKESILH